MKKASNPPPLNKTFRPPPPPPPPPLDSVLGEYDPTMTQKILDKVRLEGFDDETLDLVYNNTKREQEMQLEIKKLKEEQYKQIIAFKKINDITTQDEVLEIINECFRKNK